MRVFNDGDSNSRIVYVVAYREDDVWHHEIGSLGLKESLKRLNKLRVQNPDKEYGLFMRVERMSIKQII